MNYENCGYGYGDGGGGGDGYGYGYGDGGGGGDGYGYGYGDGGGGGYGYGYGGGDGGGGGGGDGGGYGYGDEYGYGGGDGDGYGYGYGDEYGDFILVFPRESAFAAYHFIEQSDRGYVLRNGTHITEGQELEEDEISLCKRGLHSSMRTSEAQKYRPKYSVLTKVLVWGNVIFGRDKLVSTNRCTVERIKNDHT